MEKARIAVFYGTSEGREILNFLADFSCDLTGFVATNYALDMDVASGIKIQVGRLEKAEMVEKFNAEKYDLVVDATHPYADVVTENLKDACETASVKYMRVSREIGTCDLQNVEYFENIESACEFLKEKSGNIFLTTGSKDLPTFSEKLGCERLFPRVLADVKSLEICEKAGIKAKQIFACEGPFSVEMNVAMLKSVNGKFMVTKQTGSSGGFFQKVESAKIAGATLCVCTPKEDNKNSESGENFSVLQAKKHFAKMLKPNKKVEIAILGMGVGSETLVTEEAKSEIQKADAIFGSSRILQGITANGDKLETYKTSEIANVLKENPHYRKVVICATGDVGFHSVAKGVIAEFSNLCDVKCFAGIGSLAYFMAKIGASYQDCTLLSSHGKNSNIAVHVAKNKKVFTLLGDAKNMIETLCAYNLANVEVFIGENLSYQNEKITHGKASELLGVEFSPLSVAYIQNDNASDKTDICDSDFTRGKIPMTKQEVRRVCIAKLNLSSDSVVYDIGGGTGSVSCGCGKVASFGKCYSIECEKEGIELILANSKKLSLDNVVVVAGLAPQAFSDLEVPTHAFIGGSRGNMTEILSSLMEKNPNIKIVATAVTIETIAEIKSVANNLNLDCEICEMQVSNAQKLGKYSLMKAENPIYIFTLERGNDEC